jgi:bacterioferritin-associated ferredoxin
VSDNTEPIAWAIVGRVTGRVRRVTTNDEEAREEAEHYDVWPLRRQGPITDAQVEAAAGARRCSWSIPEEDHPVGKLCRMEGHCLDAARAMLEAARDA